MKDVMGVIYTGENDHSLRELTSLRAIAAMPIAGSFRVIDFWVSSMVNSGIRNVGVIMQKNYHSLMDHLGNGKVWDLHGQNDSMYILPPFLTRENVGVYQGNLDAYHSNLGYLRRSKQKYILLTNSNLIFNTDFTDFYTHFKNSDAPIMCMYSKDESLIRTEFGMYIDVDENNYVKDIEIDPTKAKYKNSSLDVYLMKKDFLLEILDRGVAQGFHDLSRDILRTMVRENENQIEAYEYTGKIFRLDSVKSYFDCNLAMLDRKTRQQIFTQELPIFTKLRNELPARYLENAKTTDSIVADGCIIDGKVEHSVLFRGVKIGKNAIVKNCIIMQDSEIGEGAYLENCILDKQAIISKNGNLIGPSTYPIVIAKNMVI